MSSAKYPKIQFRRAIESEFVANGTVLASGEPGWATDSKTLKIGDGSTTWSALSGVATAGGVPAHLVFSTTSSIVGSSGVTNIVQISQSGFNALGSYSPSTVYLIVS